MKQLFKLTDSQQSRSMICEAVLNAPSGYMVEIKPATRTLEQNRYHWPILTAFAEQMQWPINGVMQTITADDFKQILTAAFRRESVRVAMAIDGNGVVMLGQRTSKMNKKEFSDWIEYLKMIAAERGVDIDKTEND